MARKVTHYFIIRRTLDGKNYVKVAFFLFFIFQYVTRLTVQGLTNSLKRGETDSLGFARLEYGEVSLRDAYPLGQFL